MIMGETQINSTSSQPILPQRMVPAGRASSAVTVTVTVTTVAATAAVAAAAIAVITAASTVPVPVPVPVPPAVPTIPGFHISSN